MKKSVKITAVSLAALTGFLAFGSAALAQEKISAYGEVARVQNALSGEPYSGEEIAVIAEDNINDNTPAATVDASDSALAAYARSLDRFPDLSEVFSYEEDIVTDDGSGAVYQQYIGEYGLERAFTYGDWSFNFNNTGATITKYTGSGENIIAPAYLAGKNITSISNGAFENNYGLKSLILPDTVTYIGADAFKNCRSLSSVTLPNNLQTLGYGAFSGCTSLTEITLPAALKYLGNNVFTNCSSLKYVRFLGEAPVTAVNETLAAQGSLLSYEYTEAKPNAGFTNPWRGYSVKETVDSSISSQPGQSDNSYIAVSSAIKSGSGLKMVPAYVNGVLTDVISGLMVDTKDHTNLTVAQFKELFNLPANRIEVLNTDGYPLSDYQKIGTGMTVVLKSADGKTAGEAVIAVAGDLAQRGKADALGYVYLKTYLLGQRQLDDLQKIAGDLNGDGKITVADQAILKAIILGMV